MREYAPAIGQCKIFNLKTSKKKKREMSMEEVNKMRLPFLVLLILQTNNGGIEHAVTVVDDLIFGSTQNLLLSFVKKVSSFYAIEMVDYNNLKPSICSMIL